MSRAALIMAALITVTFATATAASANCVSHESSNTGWTDSGDSRGWFHVQVKLYNNCGAPVNVSVCAQQVDGQWSRPKTRANMGRYLNFNFHHRLSGAYTFNAVAQGQGIPGCHG